MSDVARLRQSIRDVLDDSDLWIEPVMVCAKASVIEYLVNRRGEYLAVRMRLTYEPPYIWVDTKEGTIKAIYGEKMYAEPFKDTIGLDDWCRESWTHRFNDEDRDELGIVVPD